jgi:hypothetical protein
MVTIVKNRKLLQCLFGIGFTALLTFVVTSYFTNISNENNCNAIIKSRVINDIIALEQNRTDIVLYTGVYETVYTIAEIGKHGSLKNYQFMCEYWNDDFKNIVDVFLEKMHMLEGKHELYDNYRDGKRILDENCKSIGAFKD